MFCKRTEDVFDYTLWGTKTSPFAYLPAYETKLQICFCRFWLQRAFEFHIQSATTKRDDKLFSKGKHGKWGHKTITH